jgi:hypothetical protein
VFSLTLYRPSKYYKNCITALELSWAKVIVAAITLRRGQSSCVNEKEMHFQSPSKLLVDVRSLIVGIPNFLESRIRRHEHTNVGQDFGS